MEDKCGLDLKGRALVAGSVTCRDTLFGAETRRNWPCDLVEIRLDMIGPDTPNWLRHCTTIEHSGTPVLFTLRLEAEGGGWTRPDGERRPWIENALGELSAVDVEYRSPLCLTFSQMAHDLGKTLIASFHDFEKTPPLDELQRVVDAIRELPCAVPKMVCMVRAESDIETLARLLERNHTEPICVLGMGDLGQRTRLGFPRLGSCLTYGFLDAPSAPGQLTACELRERLRAPEA